MTQHRLIAGLDRAGFYAVLAVPIFLVHGRVLGEALMVLLALGFLLRAAWLRTWSWLATPWLVIGLLWWGWIFLCSLPRPGAGGLAASVQALAALRFLIFVAALEHWLLREGLARRWLQRVLALAALYIALQALVQFATGKNLFGAPRGGDGELTGPYRKPRAGAQFSLLLYPAMLPLLARGLRGASFMRGEAVALGLAGIAVMVLIGQRMPLLLTLFGLLVAGLWLPRLRMFVLAALLAAAALIGASAIVAPPTFYRLVTKFSDQMAHFPESPYGVIYARARAMTVANPLTGLGFDGFRHYCGEPRYFHGWRWPADPTDDGGGIGGCQLHPHNFYLEAATNGGLPGLLLFAALAGAWLITLGRGLRRDPAPLRVGLFVAALIYLWPIASTSAFTSMPLAGFFFVQLGLGLALARAAKENPGEGLPRA